MSRPKTAGTKTATAAKRLLVLDDRRKDVEAFLQRAPIQEIFKPKDRTSFVTRSDEVEAIDDNHNVIVARTLAAGLRLIETKRFDLIVSDLLLFDPDVVDKIVKDDYFPSLPLEQRRVQIASPSGLHFMK